MYLLIVICDSHVSDVIFRSARSLLNLTASSSAAVGANNGGAGRPDLTDAAGAKFLSDGISQLTMGSFQSVHSNAVEKNRILYTLLQHGVETTVDRLGQKFVHLLTLLMFV